MFLLRKMFRMISIMFSKTTPNIIDKCLKISIDCFGKQSIVFHDLVNTVNQNVISDFNDF